MKRQTSIMMLALALLSCTLLTSCDEETDNAVYNIARTQSNIKVAVGETVACPYTADSGAKLTFTVADPALASINANGHVTGISPGLTFITIKAEGSSEIVNISLEVTAATTPVDMGVNYLAWDATTKALKTISTGSNYIEVTSTTDFSETGTYVVKSSVTLGNLAPASETKIILCDGTTLTVNGTISGGGVLNIHAQTTEASAGAMVVTNSGLCVEALSELNIHCGNITITDNSTTSHDIAVKNTAVNIYGGKTFITSTGIGIGNESQNVNVYGGLLTANGGWVSTLDVAGANDAGIVCPLMTMENGNVTVCGYNGLSGALKMSGDESVFTADNSGYGISAEPKQQPALVVDGGQLSAQDCTDFGIFGTVMTVNSGKVKVSSKGDNSAQAAIHCVKELTINGGEVEVTSETCPALHSYMGSVTLTDGKLTVSSNSTLGDGIYGFMSDVNVSGGILTTYSKNSFALHCFGGTLNVSGGELTATSDGQDAIKCLSILSGLNEVTVSGGQLTATGGPLEQGVDATMTGKNGIAFYESITGVLWTPVLLKSSLKRYIRTDAATVIE